jgi:hypothetical protein
MKQDPILLLFSFLVTVIFFVWYNGSNEKKLHEKFDKIEANMVRQDFDEIMGTPDEEFTGATFKFNRVLKYKTFLGWQSYVFIFDRQTGLLEGKYIDD